MPHPETPRCRSCNTWLTPTQVERAAHVVDERADLRRDEPTAAMQEIDVPVRPYPGRKDMNELPLVERALHAHLGQDGDAGAGEHQRLQEPEVGTGDRHRERELDGLVAAALLERKRVGCSRIAEREKAVRSQVLRAAWRRVRLQVRR